MINLNFEKEQITDRKIRKLLTIYKRRFRLYVPRTDRNIGLLQQEVAYKNPTTELERNLQ